MIEISRHTLPNGLRIIHNRDITTRFVAVNMLYNVGSKNEDPQATGLAHLLEHLMFSGSENVPDFDYALQLAGGESNAWTNTDHTNYYDILPVQNVETALWLESDRLKYLTLNQKSIDIQKSVVIEEFKERCLNSPYGDLSHVMRKNLFHTHPYAWPVIGKDVLHIEAMDYDKISAFYNRYYAPSNAILTVVGDIESDCIFDMANKWFGEIDKPKILLPTIPSETQKCSSVPIRVVRHVPQNLIVKAYYMCDRRNEDYQASDIISDLLANGQSSRFFQRIVSKGKCFTSLDASIWGTIEEGAFLIQGCLLPGVSYEEGNKLIEDEITRLWSDEIEQKEIDKCVNKFESKELFSNLNALERAQKLAHFESIGDANIINTEILQYKSLTPQFVSQVAKKLLNPNNCLTLYYGE